MSPEQFLDETFDVNLDRNVRKKIFFGKVCQKATKGDFCPECAKSDELYREARNTDDKGKKSTILEQAKALYWKSKIFISAINVRDEDKSMPVRVYALPPSVYDDLMGQIKGARALNPKTNVFHPVTGRNILVTKKGQGILTRYTVQIDSEPSELPNRKLLEQLKSGDLSSLPNLEQVEEFIAANYLHIATLDEETNIIRLVPPFDRNTIYKELKFHRFTVESYQQQLAVGGQKSSQTAATSQALPTPKYDDSGKLDEFDPFDLPSETSPVTKPITIVDQEIKAEALTPVSDNKIDILKAQLSSITSSTGGQVDIEDLMRKVQAITSTQKS